MSCILVCCIISRFSFVSKYININKVIKLNATKLHGLDNINVRNVKRKIIKFSFMTAKGTILKFLIDYKLYQNNEVTTRTRSAAL